MKNIDVCKSVYLYLTRMFLVFENWRSGISNASDVASLQVGSLGASLKFNCLTDFFELSEN